MMLKLAVQKSVQLKIKPINNQPISVKKVEMSWLVNQEGWNKLLPAEQTEPSYQSRDLPKMGELENARNLAKNTNKPKRW